MIKRRLEMVDSEPGISPAAESIAPTEKDTERTQFPRKTTVEDVSFDDVPEEVSEVRTVQKRREPKIVPPKNGEEMLRRRQAFVRAGGEEAAEKERTIEELKRNAEKSTERIEDALDAAGTYTRLNRLTPETAKKLIDEVRTEREYLESLQASLLKLPHWSELATPRQMLYVGIKKAEMVIERIEPYTTSF